MGGGVKGLPTGVFSAGSSQSRSLRLGHLLEKSGLAVDLGDRTWWEDNCPPQFRAMENHLNPWRAFACGVVTMTKIDIPEEAWRKSLSDDVRRQVVSLLYRLRDLPSYGGIPWHLIAWVLSLSIRADERGNPSW